MNMAPTDARKKLEQNRRKKLKNKNKPQMGGNVRDLRQILKKKETKKDPKRRRPNATGAPKPPVNRNVPRLNRNNPNKPNQRNNRRNIGRDHSVSYRGPSGDRSMMKAQQTNGNRRPPGRDRRPMSGGNQGNVGRQQQMGGPPPYHQHTGGPQARPMHQNAPSQIAQPPPTYVLAPSSNMEMNKHEQLQSASVLVSNLLPSITQSDIIELYGDVGPITAVNMINQTTALVCYQHSADAVNAVKVYHNRLLDGKPMIVNMMPITPATSSPNMRNRIGHPSVVSHASSGIYAPRRP